MAYNLSPEESKRISWQSIFSSLCNLHSSESDADLSYIKEQAYIINDELHQTYAPASPPERPDTPFSSDEDPGVCPKCGSPMHRVPAGVSKRTGKPYNSFWGCSNKNCK